MPQTKCCKSSSSCSVIKAEGGNRCAPRTRWLGGSPLIASLLDVILLLAIARLLYHLHTGGAEEAFIEITTVTNGH